MKLDSRLTSILLACSLGLLSSCSTSTSTSKTGQPQASLSCGKEPESAEARHLALAARSDQTFAQCVQNFMQMEKVEEVSFRFCTQLKVAKDGSVQAVRLYQSNLPNALHWCVEQQLWTRNFSGLQLSQSHSINFSTHLNLKKAPN